ncbi:MAG: MarR family winged helix-turn-helix transcriptional regulator [Acidimicrobiales bacterium]
MNPKFLARGDGNIDHEIVDLLFALMESFKEHFIAALESAELPMSQGHLLMCLEEPTPMHVLAKRMGFDASHITAIIDRLEERQFIERRVDPHDRRVKRIILTPPGAALKEDIRSRLLDTLPPLSNLSDEQRAQLRDLLATATARPGATLAPA